MSMFDRFLDWTGRKLGGWLRQRSAGYEPFYPSDYDKMMRVLRPGDVLLVEGNERVSGAIKYLTQSTWSHAALFVGDALGKPEEGGEARVLVEVNLGEGCVAVPLSKYLRHNTRICRPVGLTSRDCERVVQFMVARLGLAYDMRNIIDLMRYLLPTPPVPVRWRRRMISIGSGEPTRAICSTLIAQAFQQVRYPILPKVELLEQASDGFPYMRQEILHVRHHSLYTPRDFDLSPYFRVVKPTIETGFDYRDLVWAEVPGGPAQQIGEGSTSGG